MKTLPFLLALLGAAALTGFTIRIGAGTVWRSLASIGIWGFALLVLWQLASDVLLALAWRVACPRAILAVGLGRLIFARLMREAGMTCLPLSQLGGIALGIRATVLQPSVTGERWPMAIAASIIDLTTEVIGQIGFVFCGGVLLLALRPGNGLTGRLGLGIVLALGAVSGFIWTQLDAGALLRRLSSLLGRPAIGRRHRLLPTGEPLSALPRCLQAFYARPYRIAGGCLLHLLAWMASGVWVWLAYHLLGARPGLLAALAVEGVASGALSMSFLVPASLGVQEAAYVALGGLFGLEPALSLSLSLLRRGRDLTIGGPMLLAWQALELRRLRA